MEINFEPWEFQPSEANWLDKVLLRLVPTARF